MPIPSPRKGEKQDKFISRCMSNDTMKREYPDQKQRAGVCYTSWRQSKKKGEKMGEEYSEFNKAKSEDVKRDEDGDIIVAENVRVNFSGYINENIEENNDDE